MVWLHDGLARFRGVRAGFWQARGRRLCATIASSSAHGAVVSVSSDALVFRGTVEFTQQIIDNALPSLLANFSGVPSPFTPVLPPFYLRSVVHLCISGA